MGHLKGLMRMIPGMSKMTKNLDIDDDAFNKVESIILSMTPYERENPEVLNMSRKRRIAKGCGRNLHEINVFVKQFEDRKSTRLNSSHVAISYAVFCLQKKKEVHNVHWTADHEVDEAPIY